MKTLKVEDIYPASYETFADVAKPLSRFIGASIMPRGCIQPLAIDRQQNSESNLSSRRLS